MHSNLEQSRNGPQARSRRSKKPANPLVAGVLMYLESHDSAFLETPGLDPRKAFPSKYTIYPPMLLLPQRFLTHSKVWEEYYAELSVDSRSLLYKNIVASFVRSGHDVTHIAVNAPIAASTDVDDENVMRSPIDLIPLYSDFGPGESSGEEPDEQDFEDAFWCSSVLTANTDIKGSGRAQNLSDVVQVWAPRWTMFSRGNVSEKSRILGASDHTAESLRMPGLSEEEMGQTLGEVDVLDMYVGIGYFSLCYLKRGVRRVFGFEINPWSVEGLRRGCEANGFGCLVVELTTHQEQRFRSYGKIASALKGPEADRLRCVALLGTNEHATEMLTYLDQELAKSPGRPNTRHCNLGLLPSSRQSWPSAVVGLDSRGGWLHVHENIDVKLLDHKVRAVILELEEMVAMLKGQHWKAKLNNTYMVKMYGPAIGHYVLDIECYPACQT